MIDHSGPLSATDRARIEQGIIGAAQAKRVRKAALRCPDSPRRAPVDRGIGQPIAGQFTEAQVERLQRRDQRALAAACDTRSGRRDRITQKKNPNIRRAPRPVPERMAPVYHANPVERRRAREARSMRRRQHRKQAR